MIKNNTLHLKDYPSEPLQKTIIDSISTDLNINILLNNNVKMLRMCSIDNSDISRIANYLQYYNMYIVDQVVLYKHLRVNLLNNLTLQSVVIKRKEHDDVLTYTCAFQENYIQLINADVLYYKILKNPETIQRKVMDELTKNGFVKSSKDCDQCRSLEDLTKTIQVLFN